MIVDCLQDLDALPKKTVTKKDFVSPNEIEVKRKRWNEFLHSSGRMLFTLKREVSYGSNDFECIVNYVGIVTDLTELTLI